MTDIIKRHDVPANIKRMAQEVLLEYFVIRSPILLGSDADALLWVSHRMGIVSPSRSIVDPVAIGIIQTVLYHSELFDFSLLSPTRETSEIQWQATLKDKTEVVWVRQSKYSRKSHYSTIELLTEEIKANFYADNINFQLFGDTYLDAVYDETEVVATIIRSLPMHIFPIYQQR